MIVYHGTGRDNLRGLVEEGPRLVRRFYLGDRAAFSTTTDFKIASLFAVRRSPPAALKDERQIGVVVEYMVTSREGLGWSHAKDRGILQDEKEIAIFNPSVITIKAVWTLRKGSWKRRAYERKEIWASI